VTPGVISAFRAGALVLGLLLFGDTIALAQVELLPLGATYRYLVSSSGTNPPGAEDPSFDDSAFPTGQAPFGFNIPGAISWGLGEGLTARRHLYLSGAPTGAVLSVHFIGLGSFYINGVLVCQLSVSGGCGSDYQTIPLSDGILRSGDNVWAAVCVATCGAAYFDATISAAGGPTQITPASWGQLKTHYR
jgi:hypothetical protein